MSSSLDRGYFDDFYSAGGDPWGVETRWYEKRKRDITPASLPREKFVSAFEPGCAIGVLTTALPSVAIGCWPRISLPRHWSPRAGGWPAGPG